MHKIAVPCETLGLRQTAVNLRRGGPPVALGSREMREAWEREAQELERAMTVPYCVAPMVRLMTVRGVLGPGSEVRREDIVGVDGSPSWSRFDALLSSGHILERQS